MNHLAAALAATLLLAASPAPREAASQIATAVEDNYFDPSKAKEVAEGLLAASDSGSFDALQDPQELAQALTDYLRPFDAHFQVEWTKEAGAEAPGRAPPPELSDEDYWRRTNSGFRKVEILPGNIGFIDLRSFADFSKADDLARLAADAALRSVSNTDAVIIDLRQNGGGAPAMAGYLASAFLKPGADAYNVFHSRGETESEAPAVPFSSPRPDVPVFILISGRTASAAESLAYTLQSAKRATIVGEASMGAANPGGPVSTPSGFSVFVSRGTPINPVTGGNWEGTGVKPDVATPASDALATAYNLALEAALQSALPQPEAIEARWVLESLTTPQSSYSSSDYLGTYGEAEVVEGQEGLAMTRGRRPTVILKHLVADLFFVEDEPTRRVEFLRTETGAIKAIEITTAFGGFSLFQRTKD